MKRVLFDENMPRRLRFDFPEFEIRTVREEGWSGLKNGELLRKAEQSFEVLVTGDKRMQYQQNIASYKIAVVVVAAASTRLVDMRPLNDAVKHAIAHAQAGTVSVVSAE